MILDYFHQIVKIPRESKHEEQIIAFLEDFATSHHLEYKKDEVGNILIIKPGNDDKSIALQAHMDMVCVSNDVKFPQTIETYVDGDYLCAKDTTLGADDGIGIAAMLALLEEKDDNVPTLECLFTVDEETGLTGAMNLHSDWLKSDTLINLDSEEEGIIYIGCAGGCSTNGYFDLNYENTPENYLGISITVDGLKGGHSGSEIHVGRANAIKILAQIISENDIKIAEFTGGQVRNAIPQRAKLLGAIPFDKKEEIRVKINEFTAQIQEKYKEIDPDINITLQTTEKPKKCIKSNDIIDAISLLPHGVIKMDENIPGLVETSTNLALVEMIDNQIKISTSQRSSSEEEKSPLLARVETIFKNCGAKVEKNEGYPAWTPNFDSKILKIAKKIYKDLFSKEATVTAIHAGLECGLFLEKYPNLDMISIGPNLFDVHTPKEKLDIASAERFFLYLQAIIKNY